MDGVLGIVIETYTCHRAHSWDREIELRRHHNVIFRTFNDEKCPTCKGHAIRADRDGMTEWRGCRSLAECEITQSVRDGERASFFRRT